MDQAARLAEGAFLRFLGTGDEGFRKKAAGILALLKEAIARCPKSPGPSEPEAEAARSGTISWDETLSS